MSVLTSTMSMDDNMGLGTPNFFSSAWNPEQSDISFTESYLVDGGGYTGYAQTEQDQADYFSDHPGNRFRAQSYATEFGLDLLDSNDGLNQILGSSLEVKGTLGPEISQSTIQPAATVQSLNPFEISNQIDPAQAIPTAPGDSTVLDPVDLEALSIGTWGLDIKLSSPAIRLNAETVKKTSERKTSILHGQITPDDSPPEDRLPGKDTLKASSSTEYKTKDPLASKKRKEPTASKGRKGPENSANTAPKVKRPRKSKKKPLTREQEEAKRERFLERNRVAADKCRQNRKKWIDDLQAKVHFFTADNAAKKAALEKLEHDISQLKALLFVHSGRCGDKSIATWFEQDSTQVKEQTENMPVYIGCESFDDIISSPSGPSSSYGFENATDATLTTNGETSISTSCNSSDKGSRRSSTASNGMARQTVTINE